MTPKEMQEFNIRMKRMTESLPKDMFLMKPTLGSKNYSIDNLMKGVKGYSSNYEGNQPDNVRSKASVLYNFSNKNSNTENDNENPGYSCKTSSDKAAYSENKSSK